MSDRATKLEQQRSTEGPARRTYASLEMCRGFRTAGHDYAPADGQTRAVVSICPLTERTYWRHVGGGKWNAKDSLYEKVEGVQ